MRLYTLALLLFIAQILWAQIPQSFNYQAIARNADHLPLGNADISVEVKILRNGATVYTESNDLTTAPTGLFSIAVGNSNPADFQAIDWRLGGYELQVRLSGALDLVTPATPIIAVPFALMADEVLNEKQQLVLNGNQLSISGGNTVTLNTTGGGATTLNDLSDVSTTGATSGQVLQWNGSAWVPATVSSGGTLTDGPGIQISGNQVSNTGDINANDDITVTTQAGGDASGVFADLQIKNGAVGVGELANGAVTAPKLAQMAASSGQVLKWNGSAWAPADVTVSANSITSTQITDNSITINDLAPGLIPTTLPPSGVAGGDLNGAYPNPTVDGLQGNPVASTMPVSGQVLKWDGSKWAPATPAAGSIGWSLTGNSGTNPNTNFIGTTDNIPLVFKVNNLFAGSIDPGTYNCTFFGLSAGENNTGVGNTAIGQAALAFNTTGGFNTATGSGALLLNTTGSSNTATGQAALNYNTTGSGNTATGLASLYSNTTGERNTANGFAALYFNTTGYGNTATGNDALNNNATGSVNTATGIETLYFNTTGWGNTATGSFALRQNTTGGNNTATGWGALYSNTAGEYNTATGVDALASNTTGWINTAIGFEALSSNTTGNLNTASGDAALYYNTTGEYNTAVGSDSGPASSFSNLSNTTALGNGATVSASNTIALGNTSITSIKGQVGFTTFSDARIKTNIQENIPGLAFIQKLRPVSYHYDTHRQNALLGIVDTNTWDGKYDIEKISFSGFLAQEVEQAAQSLGYDFSGVDAPQNEKSLYGLRYAEFTVPLVKAVQEQQTLIEAQKAELTDLKSQLATLQQQVQILVHQSKPAQTEIKTESPK